MYTTFYGFNQKPFSLLPNPEFLYFGKQQTNAMSVLDFGVLNDAGFTVITGEIGAGKTTLVRYFLSQLNSKEVNVGLVTNTLRSFGEMMQWILLAFGQDYAGKSKVELYQQFVDFVTAESNKNKRVILIVDEAQNMDEQSLEELRILSNINVNKRHMFQMVLVGQPQLRKVLNSGMEQFKQRILAHYHLEALDRSEVHSYIRHRLNVADGNTELFDPHVANYIAYFSKGIPRLVNMICDLALVYGYVDQKERIDTEIIHDVVKDKMRSGLASLEGPVKSLCGQIQGELVEQV